MVDERPGGEYCCWYVVPTEKERVAPNGEEMVVP